MDLSFLSVLAQSPVGIVLAIVVALIFYIPIHLQLKPGFTGRALGFHENVDDIGEEYFEVQRGNMVDITEELQGEAAWSSIQSFADDQLPVLIAEAKAGNKTSLEEIAKAFKDTQWRDNFTKKLRLIGQRSGWSKTVYLFVLDGAHRFPHDYTRVRREAKFSLDFLQWLSQGHIRGRTIPLPEDWDIPGMGTVRLKVKFPELRESSSFFSNPSTSEGTQQTHVKQFPKMDVLIDAARFCIFAKFPAEAEQRVKKFQAEANEARAAEDRLRRENSAQAMKCNAFVKIIATLTPSGKLPDLNASRAVFGNFLAYAVGALVGYFGFQYFVPTQPPLFGIIMGLFAAAWYTTRRGATREEQESLV